MWEDILRGNSYIKVWKKERKKDFWLIEGNGIREKNVGMEKNIILEE